MPTNIWALVSVAVAIALAALIIAFAVVIIIKLLTNQIDLRWLLAEPAGPIQPGANPDEPGTEPKASISRFQFLIFTFVIAGVYLVLCLESGRFVEIPENVILLLGVSGTSYAASKGIKAAADTSQRNAAVATGGDPIAANSPPAAGPTANG
ncbi:MAG TPA: hypothetical protein VF574_01515 [Allosphingosinicella sp.]|jgi:hypothetical protein